MESWPSTLLPAPDGSFNPNVVAAVARTKMDSGAVVQRLRFTQQMCTMPSVKWTMTDAQFEIFKAWWAYKISRGADWFTISLPLGDGFATYTVRFDGKYAQKYKPVMHWEVSGTLECIVQPGMTEAELNALLT